MHYLKVKEWHSTSIGNESEPKRKKGKPVICRRVVKILEEILSQHTPSLRASLHKLTVPIVKVVLQITSGLASRLGEFLLIFLKKYFVGTYLTRHGCEELKRKYISNAQLIDYVDFFFFLAFLFFFPPFFRFLSTMVN